MLPQLQQDLSLLRVVVGLVERGLLDGGLLIIFRECLIFALRFIVLLVPSSIIFFLLVKFVIDSVVKVGVVVDLVLLVNVTHPRPEFDDPCRLDESLDAVRELY